MVVLPDGGLHDVSNGGATIDDDPFTVFLALNAWLGKAIFPDLVSDARSERLGLSVGGATGNDHSLKEGG